MADTIRLNLQVWRQSGPNSPGRLEKHDNVVVDTHASFLEMLDQLNEKLVSEDREPIVFAHDCREGICGTCGFMINGHAHGKEHGTTVCQLHMRVFKDGETLVIEPFRARAFPLIKDLMVDRSAFDRIQQVGGYASVNVGNAPEANSIPVGQDAAGAAFDAATCIGCGACVAACPNAAAMLFTSAKVGQFAVLPQGQAERERRVLRMVSQMDQEGFGACTNTYECEAACPKEISVDWIQRLNREYLRAALISEESV